MLILRPQHSQSPWLDWERALELHPIGKKIFANAKTATTGYIIAKWDDVNSFMPTHYLESLPRRPPPMTESVNLRRHYYGSWNIFDDSTKREDPLQYASLSRALNAIKLIRKVYENDRVGLVFWQHPDTAYKPRERYLIMQEGAQFPGSPRR